MKVKVTNGGGMKGLIKYQTKSDSEFVCGTQNTPANFLKETAALMKLRPDCKKHVLHFSLSLPPAERLDLQKWEAVAVGFLEKMGLKDHSFFCVRHNDNDHDHIHLAINKIGFDGKLWKTQNSAKRAMTVCSEIENEMSLTITKTLEEHKRENAPKQMSDGVMRAFQRTGKLPSKTQQAIAKRIKNERKTEDRTALQNSTRTDERNDHNSEIQKRSLANSQKNANTNHRAGSRSRDIESRENAEIQAVAGQLKAEAATPKAMLFKGRMEEKEKEDGTFDLQWQGVDRPSFSWIPAPENPGTGTLKMLSRPTEKNIKHMFEIAETKGLKPPFQISGTTEFQRECALFALANPLIELDFSDKSIERDLARMRQDKFEEEHKKLKEEKEAETQKYEADRASKASKAKTEPEPETEKTTQRLKLKM